jgi:hypothetical protein
MRKKGSLATKMRRISRIPARELDYFLKIKKPISLMEVAALLHFSISTAGRLARQNKLGGFKDDRGRWKFWPFNALRAQFPIVMTTFTQVAEGSRKKV